MKKKDKQTIINVVVLVVLMVSILWFAKYTNLFKPTIGSDDIPDVAWPFLNLKDENGRNINMLVIRGYLDDDKHTKQFLEYINRGIKFIGCSSHLSFPRKCDNTHGSCHIADNIKVSGKDVEDYVLGWCHCFREPDKYIKPGIPKILISESDFVTPPIKDTHFDIKYDYIMVQPKDNECNLAWHGHNKNWTLAEACIKILSDDLNLKGLICGREDCPVNIETKENIETTGFIEYDQFIDKIRESRFMVLPNLEDASPRILTEALFLNKPIFVNENILGGWKYVTNDTGLFFNKHNIKQQAETFLYNFEHYQPREYYINHYGPNNSGKRLRDFLKSIYPDVTDCNIVTM